MHNEHQIIKAVLEAKKDTQKADDLIRTYIPFIRFEASKFLSRPCSEQDDEYSIAMIAFHEAILGYAKERGAFLSYAAMVIRSRLIDYRRKESRHQGHVSLYAQSEEDDRPLVDTIAQTSDRMEESINLEATQHEIQELSSVMETFGVSFSDAAENSPKQERTLEACRAAIHYAIENPLVVIAAIAAFWFWQGRNDSQSAAPGATKQAQQSPAGGRRGMRSGPLAPVQAATAVEQAVPRYLTGLGTITAANTVTVRSRVDGQLIALHFQEGQQVKAGDLLAEIDPSQFKVALAQAQGQLAKDKATLANARRDLARYQQLAKTNLVSRQELDAQQALVSETEGTIKADEASVASAQLQLDWSRITAPVDGRVGLKQVDVGNQISSGDTTGIVVITQTHPIDLVFTLPESDIATVVQAQKAGKPLVVEAWDRTNSKKLSEGTLLSLDNQIDATTGTIKVKARFNNQDDALFPNQFVNARMLVDTEQNAVVIPSAALQMGNEGHFVWVLNSENKVSKHLVTPGIQDSQKVVIRAGISTGDRVVTDGIDRLTEGAKVEVVEAQSATTSEEKATSREYAKKGARS